jgi:poly(3-hydroxybutyrate) depolymerase
MTLFEQPPEAPEPDRSHRTTLKFTSPADGSEQAVDVYAPAASVGPLPLVFALHPITWTAEQDYSGGMPGLKRGYHRGWRGLPNNYHMLVAMPRGHHRRVELCSLASPEQIDDLVFLIGEIEGAGFAVDRSRVYACGLSMGGLEALVAAGRHPLLFAAVVAFNPIVDLAAWQHDLSRTSVEAIREFGTAAKIVEEVGGEPADVPQLYAERSAITYVKGISRVPTLVFWSGEDLVVPGQETRHSYRLYREVKAMGATRPICEYEHTMLHGLAPTDDTTRWQLHEWCDYALALEFLRRHTIPCLGRSEELESPAF